MYFSQPRGVGKDTLNTHITIFECALADAYNKNKIKYPGPNSYEI